MTKEIKVPSVYDELWLPKLVDALWETRRLFYRPDPLGFCIIENDMYRVKRYLSLSVEERQIEKGYMKRKT